MDQETFLPMGKIVGLHGIKGNLKLLPWAEDTSIFMEGKRIHLTTQRLGVKAYKIRWARPHKRIMLLSLEGIDTCSQAEELKGAEILVEKESLPDLEEGTYYWHEIIGLDVFQIDGSLIGRLESVMATGANDVYVVKNPENDSETLVPAIKTVVREIDLDKKRMLVEMPEGL